MSESAKASSRLRLVGPGEHAPVNKAALKSSGFFVGANLLAGVLNYLFQVQASRELPLLEFSAFNAWFANMAVLFTFSTLLQYTANFIPLSAGRVRALAVASLLALGALTASWFVLPPGLSLAHAIVLAAAAALFAWTSGQAQTRLWLAPLAIAGVVFAIGKLAALALPFEPRIDTYALALVVAYIPPMLWLSIRLFLYPEAKSPAKTGAIWTAPLVLSIVTAFFPQLDLILLHLTQTQETFAVFALASLFYKGIYFLAIAYLQWLLPHQMRQDEESSSWSASFAAAACVLLLSALAAILGPPLATKLLHWPATPPVGMIFLACVNACLLTWLFVLIQTACTRGRTALATVTVVVVAIEAGLQLALGLNLYGYLIFSIAAQGLLVAWLQAQVNRPGTTAARPRRTKIRAVKSQSESADM